MLSFLSVCSYYPRFIPGIAELSPPLYKVVSESKINKTAEIANTFERLKELLWSRQGVRVPDPTQPFQLQTDAKEVAVGAVLK